MIDLDESPTRKPTTDKQMTFPGGSSGNTYSNCRSRVDFYRQNGTGLGDCMNGNARSFPPPDLDARSLSVGDRKSRTSEVTNVQHQQCQIAHALDSLSRPSYAVQTRFMNLVNVASLLTATDSTPGNVSHTRSHRTSLRPESSFRHQQIKAITLHASLCIMLIAADLGVITLATRHSALYKVSLLAVLIEICLSTFLPSYTIQTVEVTHAL